MDKIYHHDNTNFSKNNFYCTIIFYKINVMDNIKIGIIF